MDWRDVDAATWRPTAIAGAATPLDFVEVYVPIDDGVAVTRVMASDLRVASDQADAISRFWVLRYRVRLLRSLAATLSDAEQAAVDAATLDLVSAEAEMRDVWITAHAHGDPPGRAPTLLRPSSVRVVAEAGGRDGDLKERPIDTAGVLVRAANLYRSELSRISGALAEAGLSPPETMRHPLTVALSRLLEAASCELLARDTVHGPVRLDPDVWGTLPRSVNMG